MSKNNSNDVPLRREGYTQVKGLIESIENDRNADAFREPVDWEGKQQAVVTLLVFCIYIMSWANFDVLYFLYRNGLARLPTNS